MYEDFDFLVMVNVDLGGLMVVEDVLWQIVVELCDVMKLEFVGMLKVLGMGQGGIWYLNMLGWMLFEGIFLQNVVWVFSQGVFVGLIDMVVGGVQFVFLLLVEGCVLIDVGCVWVLVIMFDELQVLFFDVLLLKQVIGLDWKLLVWCIIVVFKGMFEDVCVKLIVVI